jgi:TRAP-type mannitol/chloroaromatic compound transport system substrate-binding protein
MYNTYFRHLVIIAYILTFGLFSFTSESLGESRWRIQSAFPKTIPFLWSHFEDVANKITSQTQIEIELYPAGVVVPTFEILDSVGVGGIDGGLSSPKYWVGKNTAFEVFSGSLSARS